MNETLMISRFSILIVFYQIVHIDDDLIEGQNGRRII